MAGSRREGLRGPRIGAGRPAEAEVDAVRVERGERAELLGDDERGVIGQHDAAGADADGFRAAGDVAEGDGGGGAGDAGHVVVLGEPEAAIAEALGVAGEIERAVERIGGRAALRDGGEVEDGKGDHDRFHVRFGSNYAVLQLSLNLALVK